MKPERDMQGFATVPLAVLFDPEVPRDAVIVYLVLSSYVGGHPGDDGVSQAMLAEGSGLSKSTVKRMLLVLRQRGLVRWTNHIVPGTRCKTVNTYELIAATAVPQQLPIAQPDPRVTQNLGSHRAIRDSGWVREDVGSHRARSTKEQLPNSSDAVPAVGSNSSSVGAAKRGARLPENWKPSTANIVWQRAQGITDEFAKLHTANFVDYWVAASGRSATKLDWGRAWQQWMRTEWGREQQRLARAAERDRPAASQIRIVNGAVQTGSLL